MTVQRGGSNAGASRRLATQPRRWHTSVGVLAAAILLLPGVAAAQDDSASVTATVTVTDAVEACIVLSATAIDFGSLDFGETAGSGAYEVESCSKGEQDVYATTSNAANVEESVGWTAAAEPGVNDFAVDAALDASFPALLSADPVLVAPLMAGATGDAGHTFFAPQPGSDGAGELMTFQLTWTGVLAD